MDFLKEFDQLRLKTPRLYNINIGCENSDYCTHADKNKNCYLVATVNFSEDCLYGGLLLNSKDCVDCFYCDHGELCFECVDVDHCYNCSYSQDLRTCSDCVLSYDLVGCQNCFGCASLRQKKYCFFNEQLSKEEYEKRVREVGQIGELGHVDGSAFQEAVKKFEALKLKTPRVAMHMAKSENCSGDYVSTSKNCQWAFDTYDSQDCLYTEDCWQTKDSAETGYSYGTELSYEVFSVGLNTYNCNFCSYIRGCSDCEYCELCFSCKNCFGCVGLQGKEYHILNQPHSREEYFKKVAEIKAKMKAEGSYGHHLPTTYKIEDTAAVVMR